MLIKKGLISLCTIGVIGGSGTGIYYGVKKFSKTQEESKKKFSGSLIFTQISKEGSTGSDSKIYESKLLDAQENDLNEQECKLDSGNNLTCKISDLIDKETAQNYLKELNKKLGNLSVSSDSDLPKKLKEKLQEEKDKFQKIFDTKIYESIQAKLPDNV